MSRVSLVAAFGVGLAVGVGLPVWSATAGDAGQRVLKRGEQVTKVAPSGKARITELARGHQAFLGILELDARAAVPEHQDATEEYIHVLAGSGTMTIDGVTTQVDVGDTVYMPAFATVSYANGPEALRVVQVFAGPGPAKKYASWAAR